LAVLGANNTNTTADHEAINLEAEALAKEFDRLMTTSKYKGKNIFVSSAGSEYVSLGGRDAEMTFGIGTISYTEVYGSSARTISGGPNSGASFKLAHLPSDAVETKAYGTTGDPLVAGATYEIVSLNGTNGAITGGTLKTADNTVVVSADANAIDAGSVAGDITDDITVGTQFTVLSSGNITGLTGGITFKRIGGTDALTEDIEAVQAKINTARVQAGSQYAALESSVNYTTDLTAQYELGFNTVSDVNFSMETAHLAKNQILQQAATAMLAQANSGQQSLLQLIQG